jgi:hypothetical protein
MRQGKPSPAARIAARAWRQERTGIEPRRRQLVRMGLWRELVAFLLSLLRETFAALRSFFGLFLAEMSFELRFVLEKGLKKGTR